MQGNQIYGFRKSGYLLKKSEGKMRVKAWRKRRCEITDGYLFIYHSDETQPPTKLNLLTCQVKLVPGKEKKCFDLISYNRTYHFQVEDEHDITAWVYVLINCKEGALQKQFDDPNSNSKDFVDFGDNTTTNSNTDNNSPSKRQNSTDETLHRFRAEQQLQQQLIRQVQALAGNDRCVDCSTNKDKPTWLSTNLGVLVCIECSGIHRDLGVHLSRIQSLTLDNINTSQLLIAHNMGNDFFNEIFEAKLKQIELIAANIATPKLKPYSSMEERLTFIRSKYVDRKFCLTNYHDSAQQLNCLKEAVIGKDLKKLLQLFGEGFDIASCISDDQETSIHLSCKASREDTGYECDLFILDFIIQNSRAINKQNARGETPLHYCAKYSLPECMKLLLRSGADVNIRNNNGETPLDVVKNLQQADHDLLIKILGDA